MKLDSRNQKIKKKYFYSQIQRKKVSINDLPEFLYAYFIMRGMALKDFLCTIERGLLMQVLFQFDGNQKKASDFLGVKPNTLCIKCKKYKIKIAHEPYILS